MGKRGYLKKNSRQAGGICACLTAAPNIGEGFPRRIVHGKTHNTNRPIINAVAVVCFPALLYHYHLYYFTQKNMPV